MEPALSVIISTYNGCSKLPYLLSALREQTVTGFETIVVVDGSTDGTLQLLKDWAGQIENMQVIVQDNNGRSKVRNRGARQATGDILIFYDDDMVPKPNSVQRHKKMHTLQKMSIVSGNQLEIQEETKTDIQNYKAHLTERWIAKYENGLTRMNADNLFFTAANCSIDKTVFEELGGFNEQFTDAEDYDFAKRAMAKGIDVYFDKENVGIHRDYITAKSYVFRLRQYRNAHKKLAEISSVKTIKRQKRFFKRWVYRFFASAFWLRTIDSETLKPLPRPLRYKMYDIILHSLSVEHPEVEI